MKSRLLFPGVLALALVTGCASPVQMRLDLLGDPAPPHAATRTIAITPETSYVNVTGGQTVKFVVGDKEFAWTFNVGYGIASFDLNRVAPPGVLGHHVTAYVAPNPFYSDGIERYYW